MYVCRMYKRANFFLVNIDCGSGSAAYWMIALQSITGFYRLFALCSYRPFRLHLGSTMVFHQQQFPLKYIQIISKHGDIAMVDEPAAEEYDFSINIYSHILDCLCMFQMKKCL